MILCGPLILVKKIYRLWKIGPEGAEFHLAPHKHSNKNALAFRFSIPEYVHTFSNAMYPMPSITLAVTTGAIVRIARLFCTLYSGKHQHNVIRALLLRAGGRLAPGFVPSVDHSLVRWTQVSSPVLDTRPICVCFVRLAESSSICLGVNNEKENQLQQLAAKRIKWRIRGGNWLVPLCPNRKLCDHVSGSREPLNFASILFGGYSLDSNVVSHIFFFFLSMAKK